MDDFAVKRTVQNHFDIVRKIEAVCGEMPYAIKQLKTQVSTLKSMDNKLVSLRSKTERKASTKMIDKLDGYIILYQNAYLDCKKNHQTILKTLDEIDELNTKLADYYSSQGKRKEAKRTVASGEKFDKSSRKQIEEIMMQLSSLKELTVAMEAKSKKSGDDSTLGAKKISEDKLAEQMHSNGYMHSRNNNNHPPHDRKMPPPHYFQPVPSFNIAPISIDVNSAVNAAVESFSKMFEERIAEYLSTYEVKKPVSRDISEGESMAFDKLIEDENFALDKLSDLLEKIGGLLSGISELTSSYAALEEKTHALADSMKSVNDTQRTLARELQGIQATQKVISGDQLKLAEEQAVVVEEQKVTLAHQTELKEAGNAVSQVADALLEDMGRGLDSFKSAVANQTEILASFGEFAATSGKILEVQKNLEERQAELVEMQREALLAHKRLVRSQKAVNERSGVKLKPDKVLAENPDGDE